MEITLLLAILAGIALLLILILYFRIHAFIALLMASILVGLLAGLDAEAIINTVSKGMGGTLGFVATVVGLGAIFGGILEHSGGAKAVTNRLLTAFGESKAPLAMLLSGFIVAIPVFFDVAFIILVPVSGSGRHYRRRLGASHFDRFFGRNSDRIDEWFVVWEIYCQ